MDYLYTPFFVFILGQPNLTDVGVGFISHTVFKNAPISTIRFYPNSQFKSFTIEPKLGDGLLFDDSLGVISGTYTGEPKIVKYSITALSSHESATTEVTINYKGMNCGRMTFRWE